jgi:ParB/RepB/Spo0J family partition protein
VTKTTPPPPEPTPATFELVPLDHLVESPSNHRARSWGAMGELVASVRAKGVLQPILVRPIQGNSHDFEIVFGHRRFRAAKQAGLQVIPAVVRELTDVEALEAAIVENLQRADVHPLEEAEGLEQLLAQKERQYTVEELAAKVGKSKAYVYGRMKLTALCPEARKAFYGERLTASTALLVARIPGEALQKQALAEIARYHGGRGDAAPFREVASLVHERYMLQLSGAPFRTTDADLVPGAGPCTTCPKRTGNQRELFADVKSADVCTDPDCFGQKTRAAAERKKAEALAQGREILTEKEAAKLFRPHDDELTYGAPYVKVGDRCYDDPKGRTYGALLGAAAPVVLAQGPDGRMHELVEREAARKTLTEKGYTWAAGRSRDAASSPSARAEKAKHELKRLGIRKAIAAIVAKAEAKAFDDAALGWLTDATLDLAWHDTVMNVAHRRGVEFGKGKPPEDALDALRKRLGPPQLRGFLVEVLVTRGAYFAYQMGHTDRLRGAAKLYGVSLEKMAAEAKAEIAAKAAARKAKKQPAKKGGRRA